MQPRPKRYEPIPAEVVAAVNSLYDDELKPFGRILLKRLRERAWSNFSCGETFPMEDQVGFAHIDPKYLRRVCEACPNLCVELADGREYTALLIGRPANFVDVCDSRDRYTSELWAAASAYFASLSREEGTLPGGRYACAQLLVSRGVPFLQHRSLGEVCHIVQLAVSQRKILGYFEGNMVPYEHSEEYVKEQCAAWRQPVGGVGRLSSSQLRLATWVDVRSCLREILSNNCNPCPGTITMSNVKRLFRSHFNLELSETVLGYSRLCELLQDARLRDVCSIRSLGNGLVVVQRARGLNAGAYQEAKPFVGIVGSPPGYPGHRCSPPPPQRRSSTCASMRSAREQLEWHAGEFPGPAGLDGLGHYQEAPSPDSAPQQLEWDGYGMMAYGDVADQYCGMDYFQSHGNGFLESPHGADLASHPCAVPPPMPALNDIFAGSNTCTEHFASNFIGAALAHEVMSPSSFSGESEPGTPKEASSDNFGTDLSTGCETCSNASLDESPRMLAAGSSADTDAELVAWQMAFALHKNGGTSGTLPADEQTPPSPSQLGEQGFVVRNTFIHVPQGEQEKTKRSRSVPRCLGSPSGKKGPSQADF